MNVPVLYCGPGVYYLLRCLGQINDLSILNKADIDGTDRTCSSSEYAYAFPAAAGVGIPFNGCQDTVLYLFNQTGMAMAATCRDDKYLSWKYDRGIISGVAA